MPAGASWTQIPNIEASSNSTNLYATVWSADWVCWCMHVLRDLENKDHWTTLLTAGNNPHPKGWRRSGRSRTTGLESWRGSCESEIQPSCSITVKATRSDGSRSISKGPWMGWVRHQKMNKLRFVNVRMKPCTWLQDTLDCLHSRDQINAHSRCIKINWTWGIKCSVDESELTTYFVKCTRYRMPCLLSEFDMT